MPRAARVKNENYKLHIMVRSIKEIDLFKEESDKIRFFSTVRKFQIKYGFKVYAYCLMNNHGHLLIDCAGADISKVMHSINLSYARYYNRKYDRYGHVFQDRFKSKVVNNRRYLLTLSAYIHNNPKDITGYENNVEDYPFSSLKEYLNKTDTYGILSKGPLSKIVGFQHKNKQKAYMSLVKESNHSETEDHIEFLDEKTKYISHKQILTNHQTPQQAIKHVSKVLGCDPHDIYVKYRRSCSQMRALSCVFMANFCNLGQKEICEVIGNITQSGISYLTTKGLDMLLKDPLLLKSILDL